eukprot:967780-Rhodomonas_salina.4
MIAWSACVAQLAHSARRVCRHVCRWTAGRSRARLPLSLTPPTNPIAAAEPGGGEYVGRAERGTHCRGHRASSGAVGRLQCHGPLLHNRVCRSRSEPTLKVRLGPDPSSHS